MNKLNSILHNIIRNELKKQFTGNLGKVIEEEDKIICYVDKNKCKKDKYELDIFCGGISEPDKKMANLYRLNKPIVYVIDGIEINNKKASINGYNDCNVIIKNCSFNGGLNININGDCTLENTHIKEPRNCLLLKATKLNINNMNIQNEYSLAGVSLDIMIGAHDELNIINSTIGHTAKKTNVSLYGMKRINISNSVIKGNEIDIESENFEADNNLTILESDKITIRSSDFKLPKVNTSSMTINGEKIQVPTSEFSLSNSISEVEIKRHELINLLQNLKIQCEESILNDIEKLETELFNQPISKRLVK